MKLLLINALMGIVKSLLTEKALMNFAVILLGWLAKRTSNDLDDKLVATMEDALDKKGGYQGNLYNEVKRK